MDTLRKIVDFLKDLLDMILGKSHGEPTVNPDGGNSATTEEGKVNETHENIQNNPTGVSTTPDGGVSYDDFNAKSGVSKCDSRNPKG